MAFDGTCVGGEDLRSYFFFSRDNLGLLGTAGQRLSLAARRVLDKLKSASQALRLAGLKELKSFGEVDANAVFEALSERAKREEDLGAESASLKPMIDAAQERPGLLQPLIVAVKALPEKALPVWTPVISRMRAKDIRTQNVHLKRSLRSGRKVLQTCRSRAPPRPLLLRQVRLADYGNICKQFRPEG